MARRYSRNLRERLLQVVASGLPAVEIARTTGVSPSSLRGWKRKAASGASMEPGTSPGGPPMIGPAEEATLRAQVAAYPGATLAEHCVQWTVAGYAVVSVATMSRVLIRLGLPRKKVPDCDRTG